MMYAPLLYAFLMIFVAQLTKFVHCWPLISCYNVFAEYNAEKC